MLWRGTSRLAGAQRCAALGRIRQRVGPTKQNWLKLRRGRPVVVDCTGGGKSVQLHVRRTTDNIGQFTGKAAALWAACDHGP